MKRGISKVTPVIAKPVAKKPITWIGVEDVESMLDNGRSGGLSFNGSNIKFNISELPYCCGVFEIGELCPLDRKVTQEAFNELMEAFCEKRYTFIINTIAAGGAKNWESYLDTCPSFQLVKTFKNENSGRIVKVWLSTN